MTPDQMLAICVFVSSMSRVSAVPPTVTEEGGPDAVSRPAMVTTTSRFAAATPMDCEVNVYVVPFTVLLFVLTHPSTPPPPPPA